MKRALFVAGGVLALGVLCYAGRLWAQAQQTYQAAPAAAPRTHIALINLTYVIKNYQKYITFQNEIKETFKPYQDKDTELKKKGEALAKELQDPKTAPNKKEEIEWQLNTLKHQVEDNNTAAKVHLGKKSDEQMKILYMDVVDAAQRYATSHEFDLVLHYNDATTEADYYSPQNIARKLQSGALMPLYATPGMDISKEVVNALNYNMRPATTGAAPGGAAPAGGQN